MRPFLVVCTVKAYQLDGQEIPGPLQPIGNVLLVKVKEAADISAGGIVLPDQVWKSAINCAM